MKIVGYNTGIGSSVTLASGEEVNILPDGQFLPDAPREQNFSAHYNAQKINILRENFRLAQGLLLMGNIITQIVYFDQF